MSVRIGTAPASLAGTPETLFESVDLQSAWGRSYDVASDVQNWTEELKRIVPPQ